jgi:hypothetical protein
VKLTADAKLDRFVAGGRFGLVVQNGQAFCQRLALRNSLEKALQNEKIAKLSKKVFEKSSYQKIRNRKNQVIKK